MAKPIVERSSAVSRFLGWSSETQALPPLTVSGLQASNSEGHESGRVHDPPLAAPGRTQSKGATCSSLDTLPLAVGSDTLGMLL